MKKKFLVALTFAGLLSLVACGNADRADYANRNSRVGYNDNTTYNRGYDYNDNTSYNREYDYNNDTAYNQDNRTDIHYDFVRGLGFENVVNPNGYSRHERYRLDETNAANNDIFHGWRHTWVEPNNYLNKDIDIYRYTGDYNGEPRTIHIKSYNGEVLGGYHFGSGETAENAKMINFNGYSSRPSNDFRGAWNGLFDI